MPPVAAGEHPGVYETPVHSGAVGGMRGIAGESLYQLPHRRNLAGNGTQISDVCLNSVQSIIK